MVNPNITLKKEVPPTLTLEAKKLFRAIYRDQKEEPIDETLPRIKVSAIVSKMAFYYEKIRNSVDYKEEYLLRKNAIERILKRETIIQGTFKFKKVNPTDVSRHLLTELIRAGYLQNNVILESKIDEIAKVISVYIELKRYAITNIRPGDHLKRGDVNKANEILNKRNEIASWILAVAATDIEERLSHSYTDKAITNFMYKEISENIEIPDNTDYEDDLEIQILLSIYRNYLKFDNDMLGFVLLKYYEGDIVELDDVAIKRIALNILSLKKVIDHQTNHPWTKQLNRLASRYTVFFTMLKEVISDGPESCYNDIIKDPKAFPRGLKKICTRTYDTTRRKLWRAATRSFVYIFLTKSVFAIILEVPANKFFGQDLSMWSLAINITFPAILLIIVVAMTKKPDDENTSKIIDGINGFFFEETRSSEKVKLRKPQKRTKLKNSIFGIVYAITFILSFGTVIWALDKIHFNFVSITIFLFFLAFVSFFTIRIRRSTKELIVAEQKENLFSLFADFFYIPIIAAGKWLSEKFSKINVFVFILDFIIEAPFKIFVEITEEWTKYVKERKDEIV